MPLLWVVTLLLLSLLKRSWAKRLRWWAVGVLFVFGNGFILQEVNRLWETPITLDQDLEHHKIGVVLGGYAYYSPENDRVTFRSSSDRFLQAIRLLQTGKIEHLILSGGSGYVTMPDQKESIYVGTFLEQMGIATHRYTIEPTSRNTHENALETASILQNKGWEKQAIVLITSAYHMPRARGCFERAGLSVVSYAADPTVGERMYTFDHLFIPSAEALAWWNVILHEWVGYVSYKALGYS
jgi:uncharacterized SAM-binding protein YcdF (DUF218 family)